MTRDVRNGSAITAIRRKMSLDGRLLVLLQACLALSLRLLALPVVAALRALLRQAVSDALR